MSIQTFIQQEILLPRLKHNGVMVVYDPAQRYRELCLDLASDDTFHLRFLLCSLLPNGCLLLSATSLSKALVI